MATTNVPPMTQKILPVMAFDNRLLGTVALDAETVFDGLEEIVTIQGNPYPVKHHSMTRMSDMQAIHFMCIPMDSVQERVGMQNHLPNFGSVSDNTPLTQWVAPRTTIRSPTYDRNSTWSEFLQSRPPQDAAILSIETVVEIP